LSTTLLAGFLALLHRYSRQDDIVIGIPISARSRAGYENRIGPFGNMLALRVDASGDPTFMDFLRQTQTVLGAALANSQLPFEVLVNELNPERDLSRHPLFQIAFSGAQSDRETWR